METYYAAQFGITLSIVELDSSTNNNNNGKKIHGKHGKSNKQKAQ